MTPPASKCITRSSADDASSYGQSKQAVLATIVAKASMQADSEVCAARTIQRFKDNVNSASCIAMDKMTTIDIGATEFSFEASQPLPIRLLRLIMFTIRPRQLAAVLINLSLSAGFGWCQNPLSLDGQEVLDSRPSEMTQTLNFEVPKRPDGHILDSAKFLPPEVFQRMDSALREEARNHSVYIFVLTVPSTRRGTLDAFTKRVAEVWTEGLFGAVIVFDDGTGNVAVEASAEVKKRFHEFELNRLLSDPMKLSKRPRRSLEGLEYTTENLRSALHELKMRINRQERNTSIARVAICIFALLALVVTSVGYFSRGTRKPEPGDSEQISA